MSSVDVIVLNLNEINVVAESIYRLKKEGWNIIVVDNGSDDDSKSILRETDGITLVDLPENLGQSKGRNAGIALTTAPYVFLLDGDILYIPGTIKKLVAAIPDDAGCLGVHNPARYDGTLDRAEADMQFPEPLGVFADFPMAWTQYGLFDGDFLREVRFPEHGAFGEPGVGYEDDWIYREMCERGLKSYYVPNVIYYHEKHGGARFLKAKGMPVRDDERKALFAERWGDVTFWYQDPNVHKDFLALTTR